MNSPILILASSKKYAGVCLAGKSLDGEHGRWVRPVSRHAEQQWTSWGLTRLVGGVPQVGDVIELPLGSACPEGHQRENRYVDEGGWHYGGRLSAAQLCDFEDVPGPLWLNGYSSVQGVNDRVPAAIAQFGCSSSLALVRPQYLRFQLGVNGDKMALKAAFNYCGHYYLLCVTDEAACARWIDRLLDGHDGRADALLCVSLGRLFHDYCYKLVAGVVELGA